MKEKGNALKILIADDEENIAMGYKLALSSRGHMVTITHNGRECVKQYLASYVSDDNNNHASRTPFDLVILDFRMPEMDGIEAARAILEAQPDQRIIFASAYSKDALIESIQKLHVFAELLQKPFDLRDLIATVENNFLASQLHDLNKQIRDQESPTFSREQILRLSDALLNSRNSPIDLHKILH